MSRIVKDTLILFAITLVAGLALGVVYNVTLTARENQEEKTKLSAYETVMPKMDDFEELNVDKDEMNDFITENIEILEDENKIQTIRSYSAVVDDVVMAFDKTGTDIGYIVTVTSNEAYDGTLQMAVGVLKDGTVNGISFLSLSETPGLGMRADEDEFKDQFSNKNVSYFAYTKNGANSANEIDALSSATITTNAVTHGANCAIYCVEYILGGGK